LEETNTFYVFDCATQEEFTKLLEEMKIYCDTLAAQNAAAAQ
jgi:hypothetical protein